MRKDGADAKDNLTMDAARYYMRTTTCDRPKSDDADVMVHSGQPVMDSIIGMRDRICTVCYVQGTRCSQAAGKVVDQAVINTRR